MNRRNSRAARLLALAALLLPACAAPPSGGAAFLYFETEAYACGAEENLGCGLALQPALSRLDVLDGVAASSVSWDGRFVRVELQQGADAGRVAAAVATELEGDEKLLPEAPDEGGPGWLDVNRCLELSLHEAGVLARQYAGELAASAAVGQPASYQLESVMREALEQAFRRAHAAGGGVPRLREELLAGRTEFESQLGFLSAEQRALVLAGLDEALSGEAEDCP
jgi:hypothetical protein